MEFAQSIGLPQMDLGVSNQHLFALRLLTETKKRPTQ
jgi:hypothetical protein